MEKVSVIVPIHNTEKYLKRCLDSIIEQSYKELEIILVDDGSTDSSGHICDSYLNDPRVKVFHLENSGVSSARNVGLNNVTGNYILFVDSDDYIDIDLINDVMLCQSEHDTDIVIFNYRIQYESGFVDNTIELDEWFMDRETALKHLLVDDSFHSYLWNKFFAVHLFDGIVFDEKRNIMEDFLVLPLVFERASSVYILNKQLYTYNCTRNESLTKRLSAKSYYNICYANRIRYEMYKDRYSELKERLLLYRVSMGYAFLVNVDKRQCDEEMLKEYVMVIDFIKDNMYSILKCREISFKLKLECLMIKYCFPLLLFVRKGRF